MKIFEIQHPGEPFWLYWLGNATAIDDKYVKSIGIAWLFKEGGKWVFMPRITGQSISASNASGTDAGAFAVASFGAG